MELEFFCSPHEDLQWFQYWRDYGHTWLLDLGLNPDHLRLRDHSSDELSHYSKATTDIEYRFPFGWGELWGVADCTDYDLKQHMEHSGENFHYLDPLTQERWIPCCIEPSLGADRVTLAFLLDAWEEQELDPGDVRIVLHLHPALAPYKVAVFPLSKKLSEGAYKVYRDVSKHFMVDYDESGSIGKRYRRHDEMGTPFCITYDFESETDGQVTVRDRDSMEQVRVPIAELPAFIASKMHF